MVNRYTFERLLTVLAILAVAATGCETLMAPPGEEVGRARDAFERHQELQEQTGVDMPRAAWLIYYWSQMNRETDEQRD